MENKEIPVNRDEYARLCALDGKVDALIGYIAMAEEEYKKRRNTELIAYNTDDDKYFLDANVVKAIIGMEDDDNCLDVNTPEIIIGMGDEWC